MRMCICEAEGKVECKKQGGWMERRGEPYHKTAPQRTIGQHTINIAQHESTNKIIIKKKIKKRRQPSKKLKQIPRKQTATKAPNAAANSNKIKITPQHTAF